MKPLILASASPARARLLENAGVSFQVSPAAIDEEAIKSICRKMGLTASRIAGKLAEEKALRIAAEQPGRLVLGADQVLDLGGEIVSKCTTHSAAASVLTLLRGRTHELLTATVLASDGTILWRFVDRCRLTMRDFTDAFLADYLDRAEGAALHCVGGYELEGLGIQLFERVEGDFFSVLGLPLVPVLAELRLRGQIPT